MCCQKNAMPARIDERLLFLRPFAPQDKYTGRSVITDKADRMVGEGFPATSAMTAALACFDRHHRVHHQDSLCGPFCETAVRRCFDAQIG